MIENEGDLDQLAAKIAVYEWLNKEGQFAKAIQNEHPLQLKLFNQWLHKWNLLQWVPSGTKRELLGFLDAAKPQLTSAQAGREAYELVQELVRQAQEEGLVRGRQTSLMSKFAFSCNPKTFAPYD